MSRKPTIFLVGQQFGRLTVSGDPVHKGRRIFIPCKCNCGREKLIVNSSLAHGYTKSCGCLRSEKSGSRVRTHGKRSSREYGVWWTMVRRCYDPNVKSFKDYGGRGIMVCDRWKNGFEAFMEDMGPRPSDQHSIERKDNSLGYFKENCRWATKVEQSRNMRSNRFLTFNGETKILVDWAAEFGIKRTTLEMRVDKYGWSIERALTTPVRR